MRIKCNEMLLPQLAAAAEKRDIQRSHFTIVKQEQILAKTGTWTMNIHQLTIREELSYQGIMLILVIKGQLTS